MNKWQFDFELCLLSIDELRKLKIENPDVILISITGLLCHAKYADEDTRFGFTAYAIPRWK